ncbi:MAG: hypothetical protein SNJ56_06145 [Termitinemataceae bacterium]
MKKRLYVLVAALALLAVAGCSTGMHDGTSMYIEKIVVTGLPVSMEGRTVELQGFWNGGNPATSDKVKIVNGQVTLTLATGMIQSAPTLEFKVKPQDTDGGWDWAIGEKLRLGGSDVGNAKVSNTWTGPAAPKTIKGVVNSDNTVTWTVE